MASIKLKHSGGNGVIIAAPTSNPASDKTLTLPSDVDGTVVSKDSSNSLQNVTGINGGQLGNRNLIINGAMQVAQRGTSSTSDSYATVDRFKKDSGGTDEAITQAQVDVASGTTPYTLGFRKALKFTNGNQTSGAGATDYVQIGYSPEAQDIANSGWNYLSSSSNITFSFWAKASVAQTYQVRISSKDGTSQGFVFEYALSADTWTKITKTIPGNSNLQFDNDNGNGMEITFLMFIGTTYTSASPTLDAWTTYSYLTSRKDMASTWWTTNDATFELTGVQLEVGSVATDFEHRSFGQELALCQRYYQVLAEPAADNIICFGGYMATEWIGVVHFPQEMRIAPTLVVSNFANAFRIFGNAGSFNPPTLVTDTSINTNRAFYLRAIDSTNVERAYLRVLAANSGVYATIAVSAEL